MLYILVLILYIIMYTRVKLYFYVFNNIRVHTCEDFFFLLPGSRSVPPSFLEGIFPLSKKIANKDTLVSSLGN